ncbi:hypothetical protein DACRYDRAFT_115303 [Dacryopinax primogenitus]|uniref:RNA polymerase II-associated protein 1 C-terminal domain-containing protein n=1 Tax=Dacryopinax primogenitus (strain DJM 731) TaxID=1858805 RepID=M5G481_DACPD|nr:uncharacterized protein DACRYDRAFT_115303 [Dacryopinax primogenitus]EJU03025.1 hypothetical protein DACRYDRAFT_115303 [Dacryopinax primogenitus]
MKWEPTEDDEEHLPAPISGPEPVVAQAQNMSKLLQEVGEENDRRIAGMTEEERMAERDDLLQKFGGGVGEMLRLRRLKREGKAANRNGHPGHVDIQSPIPRTLRIAPLGVNKGNAMGIDTAVSMLPDDSPKSADAMEPPKTPVSRAELLEDLNRPRSAMRGSTAHSDTSSTIRRLRFADVTPSDIHVYPSQPTSPRAVHMLLAPPDDGAADGIPVTQLKFRSLRPETIHKRGDGPAVWLAQEQPSELSSSMDASMDMDALEEGTPEDIRHRFFPNEDAAQLGLEWITAPSATEQSSDAPRFDLQGMPIPRSLQTTLPTHLGLHHTSSSLAGYTLDDLLYLSRSTNAAQRATVLGVLAKIILRIRQGHISSDMLGPESRERILKSGIAALGEKGSVGARAVEVVWEAVVGGDESYMLQEGVELWGEEKRKVSSESQDDEPPSLIPGLDAISSIPLEEVLPLIQSYFTVPPSFPAVTLSQLLGILHRLTSHYEAHASAIIKAPHFLASILSAWLAYKPSDFPGESAQDPKLLQLLSVVAASSRSNGEALAVDVPNTLLRFIAQMPQTSQSVEERELRESLMAETLHFYATLGRYGLGCKVALIAQELMSLLVKYIAKTLSEGDITPSFARLAEAFFEVREIWTTCAIDPHKTSPPHELIWSQIEAFGWVDDLLQIAVHVPAEQDTVWAGLWSATAAYAEGAIINGVNKGQDERKKVLEGLRELTQDGNGRVAIDSALEDLQNCLDMYDGIGKPKYLESLGDVARSARLLGAAIRLSSSLITSATSTSDPLGLPGASISRLMDNLLNTTILHDALDITAPPGAYVHLRPLTTLLMNELKLSHRLGTMSMESWSTRALRILRHLLPGDEAYAHWIFQTFVAGAKDLADSMDIAIDDSIINQRCLEDVLPFYMHAIRPDHKYSVASFTSDPQSLPLWTRITLPSLAALHKPRTSTLKAPVGLPLKHDYLFQPLSDLLRSATTTAFESFPVSWNASETEVTRATLFGAEMYQTLLLETHPLEALRREEIVFGCMRVVMLEHGQPQGDSSEDVFRDAVVSGQMKRLLEPFLISPSSPALASYNISSTQEPSLEAAAKDYLGSGVPFYQFYTDLLALYEAISFADPVFSALLLPPLSMPYPPDYRQLFWGENSVAPRMVRTEVGGVPAEGLGEFLWPVEGSTEMLGRYVRALVDGTVGGFLRVVARHHVACSIWLSPAPVASDNPTPATHASPNTRSTPPEGGETRRRHLLLALLRSGKKQVVADILTYQPEVLCEGAPMTGREERLAWVRSWGGQDVVSRLDASLS